MNKWKTPDIYDLCRYDKEYKFIADIYVLSDDFILGNEGERLRIAVSEYGFNRLLSDDIDGLITILPSSIQINTFEHPDITNEDIERMLKESKDELIAKMMGGNDEAE